MHSPERHAVHPLATHPSKTHRPSTIKPDAHHVKSHTARPPGDCTHSDYEDSVEEDPDSDCMGHEWESDDLRECGHEEDATAHDGYYKIADTYSALVDFVKEDSLNNEASRKRLPPTDSSVELLHGCRNPSSS